ncbi:MAG TPA: Tm-1-like ATP-binding domain-containing protein [Chloroflexota bacterium]|nr:Tm-1-like ATP-binding domain-containing protein [Chloroflexota bacterium]HUM70070.1 Tm-1-like ATP-binding domain-containing protein [Chloroflexota bacterium]
MTKTIALVGALDTKGAEFAFVKGELLRRDCRALVINIGIMGEPAFAPEIDADVVAQAGGRSLADLRTEGDRGTAVATMTTGIAIIVKKLYDAGEIDGILSMGGSAGTVIATAAMRQLPIGFPKVMVSTLAAGDTAAYVGTKDIVLIPSVVDVAGVNRISASIFAHAVGAIVGMVDTAVPTVETKPLIAASMFGNTTKLVDQCRAILDKHGYETLVFHATGTGGRTMESLINEGYFTAVLDVTTTEWADELVGGFLTAGPERMDAATRQNLPQVIAPGCLDMVNFWGPDSVPAKYQGRQFYHWNPNVTLMRTTPEENAKLGRILAEKANQSAAPVAFFLPLLGISVLDSPGGEFWWPEADRALFDAIKAHARAGIPVYELDCNINDDAFAAAVTGKLLEFVSGATHF